MTQEKQLVCTTSIIKKKASWLKEQFEYALQALRCNKTIESACADEKSDDSNRVKAMQTNTISRQNIDIERYNMLKVQCVQSQQNMVIVKRRSALTLLE